MFVPARHKLAALMCLAKLVQNASQRQEIARKAYVVGEVRQEPGTFDGCRWNLDQLAALAEAQKNARNRGEPDHATTLDRELDLAFDEKQRSGGRLARLGC